MRESDFQRTVIEMAQRLSWRVAHFRPAQTEKGWRTPVAADGKGFVDLVLVRDRVLFVELKTDKGKLSLDQEQWRRAINGALDSWLRSQDAIEPSAPTSPFVHLVWRPADLDRIEEVLRG